MIAIKAIIITTISINFIVNSTKFGSTTKLNQNIEQIPEEVKFCQESRVYLNPHAIRNGNGRFVFQVNEIEEIKNFVQLVEVVFCRDVESERTVGEEMKSKNSGDRE